MCVYICVCVCVCMYMYVYMYMGFIPGARGELGQVCTRNSREYSAEGVETCDKDGGCRAVRATPPHDKILSTPQHPP